MTFTCKIYGLDKVIVQIFPTCPRGDYVNSPQFEYGELITWENPLDTSRIIMEVPRGFLNPNPGPNSSNKKPSKVREKGSLFH